MTVLIAAGAMLASSTSYCLSGTMADGTPTRWGSAASNHYPLGTRIAIDQPFYGRRRFTVRDRIGWGSDLDLWAPACSMSYAWGRRLVRVRAVARRRYRCRPRRRDNTAEGCGDAR